MAFGEAYLTSTPSFGDLPAEPWGSESVVIDLAGGPYRFSGLASAQADWVRDRFQALCHVAPEATAPVNVTLHRLPESAFRVIGVWGWEYTFDRDYCPERVRLAGLDFVAEIHFAPALHGRIWTSRVPPDAFDGMFENFFRVMAAYRITQCGGVLLHSGAFARNGRAQVVFGRSGAGKSTSSRLALDAGWEVLSDDLNALLCDQGGWRVEKLPFSGDLGQTPTRGRTYPIAGLYWLRHTSAHAVRPMLEALALARLLACTPIVNEDPYRVGDALRNLKSLVTCAGARALDFAPDAGFLALLEAQH